MEPAKLIKICDILFYANTVDAIQQTFEMEFVLKHYGIGCFHRIDLAFNDPTSLIGTLRTATYGLNFESFPNLTLPIVTWKEYYDDYERCVNIARSPKELQLSTLIVNLHLILPEFTS